MPISLNSPKTVKMPNLENIQDPQMQQILNDMARVIKTMAQNTHDDLTALNAVVDKKANA